MVYRTLEDLRSELRTVLGFGAAGAVPGVNQTLLNSFLRQAQAELYWQGSWAELRARADLSLGSGQTLINYPSDCNPERIEDLYVQVSSTWLPITEGIEKQLYTTVDSTNYPSFYERRSQIELWPESDQAYTLRIWYYKVLGAFTQDGDRATLNDDLVLARAIALGKAHYRHPDADKYETSVATMINGAKGGAWRRKVFSAKRTPYDDIPLSKPRTV